MFQVAYMERQLNRSFTIILVTVSVTSLNRVMHSQAYYGLINAIYACYVSGPVVAVAWCMCVLVVLAIPAGTCTHSDCARIRSQGF